MICCARATRGLRRPSLGLVARHGKSIVKQSEGRAGEKYLPVGGTGEKVVRSGKSISPHPWRENKRAWKNGKDTHVTPCSGR